MRSQQQTHTMLRASSITDVSYCAVKIVKLQTDDFQGLQNKETRHQ